MTTLCLQDIGKPLRRELIRDHVRDYCDALGLRRIQSRQCVQRALATGSETDGYQFADKIAKARDRSRRSPL